MKKFAMLVLMVVNLALLVALSGSPLVARSASPPLHDCCDGGSCCYGCCVLQSNCANDRNCSELP